MALTFGKINRSAAFNPTTAFPLDARYYFESKAAADTAAAGAVWVGSSEGTYFFGENVVVVENGKAQMYIIQPDKTLSEVGASITINENIFAFDTDGKLDLYGFADAVAGAQLTKGSDGKLSWVKPDTTTVEGLSTEVESLRAAVDTLNGTGDGSVQKIAEAAADARVNAFAAELSDDDTVNTFKELVDYVAEHGTEAADMAADILALQGLVGETAVATQIVNAIDEALKVDGVDKYALATELATAVERIEANETGIAAIDEKLIESIKINGIALTVTNKSVDIPLATAEKLGLVKGTDAENGVSVAEDGTMSVNSININKLVQTEGDLLVLDGGRVGE